MKVDEAAGPISERLPESEVAAPGTDQKETREEGPEEQGAEDHSWEEDSFDVFGVSNVSDLGSGVPLFAHWTFEDWALLCLRFELNLLVHAFRQDVNDPERVGIHADHLQFYYHRYFRKNLQTKLYGVDTLEEVAAFVSDSVSFSP